MQNMCLPGGILTERAKELRILMTALGRITSTTPVFAEFSTHMQINHRFLEAHSVIMNLQSGKEMFDIVLPFPSGLRSVLAH